MLPLLRKAPALVPRGRIPGRKGLPPLGILVCTALLGLGQMHSFSAATVTKHLTYQDSAQHKRVLLQPGDQISQLHWAEIRALHLRGETLSSLAFQLPKAAYVPWPAAPSPASLCFHLHIVCDSASPRSFPSHLLGPVRRLVHLHNPGHPQLKVLSRTCNIPAIPAALGVDVFTGQGLERGHPGDMILPTPTARPEAAQRPPCSTRVGGLPSPAPAIIGLTRVQTVVPTASSGSLQSAPLPETLTTVILLTIRGRYRMSETHS